RRQCPPLTGGCRRRPTRRPISRRRRRTRPAPSATPDAFGPTHRLLGNTQAGKEPFVPTSAPTDLSVETIRDLVTGTVIGPHDEEYEAARTAFAGGIDKHPAAIGPIAD